MNLALLHEEIAAAVGTRECIVQGDRRLTWVEVTDRTRRLATFLRNRGLGRVTERSALPPWESGQDHVALLLYNGPEYLEAMLGAFKARAIAFNVNYRYVTAEIAQVFADARPRAVVYHTSLGDVLAPALAGDELLVHVDDGGPALPGSVGYEDAIAGAAAEAPRDLSPDDGYLLYTGGTTGAPKGALWRQADIFVAGMGGRRGGREPASTVEIVERARRGGFRVLPLPPMIHGASQWMAFTAFSFGGTVILPSSVRRFDPAEAWETAEREDATAVTMVGDAFGRPLLDALRRRPRDLPHLRTINNGGAAVSRPVRDGLLELLPRAALADALGSSESGVLAAGQSRLHLQPGGAVLSADLTRVLGPGTDELGWLATGGRIPLGYLHDPGTTAATFPRIGGVRHSVPGDRVVLRADGTLDFRGRDSMTVNSGGEKVFVEEVEQALAAHPAVADVLVVGRASERWGQELVAVVQAAGRPVERGELLAACESRLARYKWPKDVIWVEAVRRSPSGKGDYRWAAAIAAGRRPGQD